MRVVCTAAPELCVVGATLIAADMCSKQPSCVKAVNSVGDEASRRLSEAQKALGNLMDKAAAESKTGRTEYVYTLRAERDGN